MGEKSGVRLGSVTQDTPDVHVYVLMCVCVCPYVESVICASACLGMCAFVHVRIVLSAHSTRTGTPLVVLGASVHYVLTHSHP